MRFCKFLKHTIVFLLAFLLGPQTIYAKTKLILPQNGVSFSIVQNQSFLPKAFGIEKEVQPNVGFLKEKFRFVVSERISAQNTYNFSKVNLEGLADAGGDLASLFPKLAGKLDDWAHLGLNFNKVDDIVKITAQNGDEVAKVFKNGAEEVFEIADDFFADIPTTSATPITGITVKANTGEIIIGGGFFKNADGSISFVEDVSSYGNTIVQNTIKRRGNLRKSFDNIVSTEDAHHLFPIQTLKENQWVKKGVEGGFEFNKGSINGIPVEKYVKATGVGRHGPHPQLTKQIQDHMNFWAEQTVNGVKNKNLSPLQTADYMRGLANSLKNKINNSTVKLNDLNLNLPH